MGKALNSKQSATAKFKPFELQAGWATLDDVEEEPDSEKQCEAQLRKANNITMRACNLVDEKSQTLYEKMNAATGHNAKKRAPASPEKLSQA